MAHLYATFADAALAEKAAGALLDYGVRKEDVSIVANDAYGKSRTTTGAAVDTATDAATGAGRGAANLGAGAVDATKSVGDRLEQAGDKVAGAVAGAVGADRAAANYDAGADRQAAEAQGRTAMAGSESVVHDRPTATSGGATVGTAMTADASTTETAAKHGISTTTPEDAGEGAVKGTGIGLGVGVAAALASLLVPGVGLVIGGGALASALGGAALAAGAGAVAGGVTGYLKEQGVPGDAAQRYHGAVESGGAMLTVNLPSGDVDQATAEGVLSKYGAADVNSY